MTTPFVVLAPLSRNARPSGQASRGLCVRKAQPWRDGERDGCGEDGRGSLNKAEWDDLLPQSAHVIDPRARFSMSL